MKTTIALLDSEERAAEAVSEDQSTHVEDDGALFILDITKAPNTEEKLEFIVEARDDVSGKYVPITAFAATKKGSELAAGVTLAFTVYPAAAETAAIGNHEVQALPIPNRFRVKVKPSGASKWTYSVGMQLLG